MLRISATNALRHFAALLDAAQHEPVVIRRQKRDVAILLSPQEFDRLRGLKVEEPRQSLDGAPRRAEARGITESKLEGLVSNDTTKTHRR